MPSALTQATQATKNSAPPIRPIRESTKPAVRTPLSNPAFLAFPAIISPMIPKITDKIDEYPKNQHTTAIIPSTRLAVAAPFPGTFFS